MSLESSINCECKGVQNLIKKNSKKYYLRINLNLFIFFGKQKHTYSCTSVYDRNSLESGQRGKIIVVLVAKSCLTLL